MARAKDVSTSEKARPRRFGPLDPERASQLIGIVAAVIVAVLANVFVARRYTRWDWTENKRYSLSPATVQTLRGLEEPVSIWLLLGPADPLEQSVKQLLVAYAAETTKIDVHYIDPDRDVLALEDVKKRFKIETGRTEQGHVITDAVAVVARGDKHWFLTAADMVQVADAEGTKVSPREEQALTSAIRNVLGGTKAKLCFTTGHGEMSPLDASDLGTAVLKDILEKDNYEVTVVDTSAPNAHEPFAGCEVAIVAGMRGAFSNDEAERLRTYVLGGGNLLLAASPIVGDTQTGLVAPGLGRVLSPFGIGLDDALVIERDPDAAFPGGGGMRFVAQVKDQPITHGLVRQEGSAYEVPRVVLQLARPLRHVSEPGSPAAVDLLATSDKAFALTNVVGAADWQEEPKKREGDLEGPLVLAMASERPKLAPSAPHGPRVVVLGSASMLTQGTFREPLPLRGSALVVESAISWLASKPQVLDIPERSAVAAGLRITEESRAQIRRYVLFFMPGASALLGVCVAFLRRSSEGKKRAPKGKAGKA